MDYQETVAGVGLISGGFVDGNSLAGTSGASRQALRDRPDSTLFRSTFAPISAALASQRAWLNVYFQSRR
ncbi:MULTISPECIES: hypothetical protein [Pseudomonas]|uniref:hypothetical protein n=1 Tax=Pseudomonas TaxID=286 RepID=UPI0011B0622D|nr:MULTISPECIES: hypothetical protein [Pseudomonas]MCP1483985.1 hypothetical protein [Pseudomonas fluorescens]